jgi:hypothetical protein
MEEVAVGGQGASYIYLLSLLSFIQSAGLTAALRAAIEALSKFLK